MASESKAALLDSLLAKHQYHAVIVQTTRLKTTFPRNGLWWLASARAAFALGHLQMARSDISYALRLLPNHPPSRLLNAAIEHRLGHTSAAITELQSLVAAGGSLQIEATIVLAEVLARSRQSDELDRLIASGGP